MVTLYDSIIDRMTGLFHLFIVFSLTHFTHGLWKLSSAVNKYNTIQLWMSPYNHQPLYQQRKYPLSKRYYEQYMRRNTQNPRNDSYNRMTNDMFDEWMKDKANEYNETRPPMQPNEIKIIIHTSPYQGFDPANTEEKKP